MAPRPSYFLYPEEKFSHKKWFVAKLPGNASADMTLEYHWKLLGFNWVCVCLHGVCISAGVED